MRYFQANIGRTIVLHTGQVGDEGWFAPETIPNSWNTAGPTGLGLRNYLLAGPGLGSPNAKGDREALLDKVPDVNPLRATGLKLLQGRTACAVVYKSDISINYSPLNGSLKSDNRGIVAFTVDTVQRLTGASSSSMPKVTITIRDANQVCSNTLAPFTAAPAPTSSSTPHDQPVATGQTSDAAAGTDRTPSATLSGRLPVPMLAVSWSGWLEQRGATSACSSARLAGPPSTVDRAAPGRGDRVKPVVGDLLAPRLGLGDERIAALGGTNRADVRSLPDIRWAALCDARHARARQAD